MYRILPLLTLLIAGCTGIPNGIAPVDQFELERYLGTWYEVARFDHRFERGLSKVSATYSLRKDGGITVLNKGYNQNEGEWEEANGKAYFVQDSAIGHLKVSFFGPFYASYVVFELDKRNYSYALVTGPNRDYLWILARDPNMSESQYNALLQIAAKQGFDIGKLIRVQH